MTRGDKVLGRNIKKSKEKRESWGDERAGQVLIYTYGMIMEGLFDKVTGEQKEVRGHADSGRRVF